MLAGCRFEPYTCTKMNRPSFWCVCVCVCVPACVCMPACVCVCVCVCVDMLEEELVYISS